KERNVEITGEVYFEVAHNASKPFIVKVNEVGIKDLGTSFNVNAYEDESSMKTTLLEGSVKVSEGNQSVIIVPGEQALVTNSDKFMVKRNIDMEAVVAWKSGFFEFEQTSLSNLLRQISRWYDVEVVYPDNYEGAEKFGGRISKNLPL